jgi:hypothetical protein
MSKRDINSKVPSFDSDTRPIPSLMQHPPPIKNCVNISDLPSELILAIFEPLCPIFKFEPLCPIFAGLQINLVLDFESSAMEQIPRHARAVKKYVDFRLICSRLNQVLTPIAFREMVVYITGSTRLEKVAMAFERGADFVRRLIIFGTSRIYRPSSCTYADATQTISDGLDLCSQIESLECYGNHHVFPHRRWLRKAAPNLPSTVTSLVFSPNIDANGMDLSHALVGLGSHLQTLEITAWTCFPIGSPFHLPSKMPQLTNLALRGGSVDMKNLKKLITRATRKKALRSLSISDFFGFRVAHMMAILSINNLCFQLTVLHWCPSSDNQDSLIPILKACPNLVDFSYAESLQRDIFDHLPPKLQYLELFAVSLARTGAWRQGLKSAYWNGDFVSFLKSGRCPVLRKLTVLDPSKSQGLDESLSSACDDVGVTLVHVYPNNMKTWLLLLT